LSKTPTLQRLFRQSLGGVRPVRALAGDHVVIRSFFGRPYPTGPGWSQFSRDRANPQVGAASTLATDVVVVHVAQELATSVETNSGRPVSGHLANGQVSSVNSGQTRGDLTLAAEPGGLADERLIRLALACALEDPDDLGQQVGATSGELAERGHRRGLLVAGERAPLRAAPGLPRQPRYQDPISLRAIIEHEFEYYTR